MAITALRGASAGGVPGGVVGSESGGTSGSTSGTVSGLARGAPLLPLPYFGSSTGPSGTTCNVRSVLPTICANTGAATAPP